MKRYVALGSSMAAGPGIRPRAAGAPWASGRSARNYPHLVAERLDLNLVDVTYSGATTTHVLSDNQRGAPPQIAALNGSEALVTVTIGGNDVGYIPLLMAAALPRGVYGGCRWSVSVSMNCWTAKRVTGRSRSGSVRYARSVPRYGGVLPGPGCSSLIT